MCEANALGRRADFDCGLRRTRAPKRRPQPLCRKTMVVLLHWSGRQSGRGRAQVRPGWLAPCWSWPWVAPMWPPSQPSPSPHAAWLDLDTAMGPIVDRPRRCLLRLDPHPGPGHARAARGWHQRGVGHAPLLEAVANARAIAYASRRPARQALQRGGLVLMAWGTSRHLCPRRRLGAPATMVLALGPVTNVATVVAGHPSCARAFVAS